MRMCAKLIAITGLLLLPAIFASADTKVLRLVSSSGSKVISGKYDAPISVEVRVDNAQDGTGYSKTAVMSGIYLLLTN